MTEDNNCFAKKGLSSNVLKLIAVAAMLCDHVSVVFFGDDMTALRWIGRLAFPIFCYFVAVGAQRTHSVARYMLRLAVFALISEVPFDLAFFGKPFDITHQNVFFTLLGGLFSIWCHQALKKKSPRLAFLSVLPLGAVALIAELLETDYGAMGVLAIFSYYLFMQTGRKAIYVSGVVFSTFLISVNLPYILIYSPGIFLQYPVNRYELGALAAVPLLLLYTGKRKHKLNKYFFYIFYPAHLLALWGISLLF